jgi:hypothetical protein
MRLGGAETCLVWEPKYEFGRPKRQRLDHMKKLSSASLLHAAIYRDVEKPLHYRQVHFLVKVMIPSLLFAVFLPGSTCLPCPLTQTVKEAPGLLRR